MKNVNQDIQNFFNDRIAEIKQKQEKDLKELMDYIKGPGLLKMSDSIDKKWNFVVEAHKNQESPLKLVIIGEAPLKLNKYFYINQGTFLDSLRDHWQLKKNNELPLKMLEKRILVLDIYKYPIPSEFYKKDKNNVLLDEDYLNKKINLLKQSHLINEETHFVFRYKQLFEDRKLNTLKSFNELNFISSNKEIVSLNTGEKPQKLNTTVKDFLVKNCS